MTQCLLINMSQSGLETFTANTSDKYILLTISNTCQLDHTMAHYRNEVLLHCSKLSYVITMENFINLQHTCLDLPFVQSLFLDPSYLTPILSPGTQIGATRFSIAHHKNC